MKSLLYTILLGIGFSSMSQNVDPELNLASGKQQLSGNLESFISAEIKDSKTYYRLVQFYQTPDQETKEAMEATGLKFYDYIPKHAYLLGFPANYERTQLADKNIFSISPIFHTLKINPQIEKGLEAGYYNKSNELLVTLRFFEDVNKTAINRIIQKLGVDVLEFNEHLNQAVFLYQEENLSQLTAIEQVKLVDVMLQELRPEDNLGRALHRSSSINHNNPLGPKFDGSGVNVAVNDDGEVGPHIDFTGRTEQSDVAGDQTGDHGDMVAGILGGAGNLNPLHEGMAKGAFLRIRQYSGSLPNTLTLHQNDDVMIFSSSYGNGCNAGYTGLSSQVDQEIRQNPSLIQVFSCGNSGGSDCGYGAGSGWGNITGGHKQGKNVIATANMERDEGLAASSSRGPAMDGRIKPDITAHGNGQISTDPNNLYSAGGGTSAAAPGISGILAQLYQAYRSFNGGNNPESALLKSSLLNSADDLGNVGPDFEFGWGRVNAKNALEIIENNQYYTDDITQFDTDNYSLTVPAGVQEVKIMLYWTDYEGNPVATTALVNDLDLEVNNGSINLPWVLDPTPNPANLNTPATTGVDHLNNMEQVSILNPAAGTLSISVNGFDVPQGPQRYYVVYRFIYDDITVIYPNAGEGFVSGETERIFWDAYDNSGNFDLEYTVDNGSNWTPITSVPGTDRSYDWTVPSGVSGLCKVRVRRSGITDDSDANFSIIDTPENIEVSQVCPGYVAITWDTVTDASGYIVYLLGTEYMDSIGTTSTNVFQVPANINIEHWISVAAIPNNNTSAVGRRAIAIYYDGSGVLNCSAPDDLAMHEVVSPGITEACSFDNTPVSIKISNFGQSNQSNFDCKYEIQGQGVVSETYSGTIIPGQIANFTFSTPFSLSTMGTYPMKIWVEPTADSNPLNDSSFLSLDFGGTIISNFPATEDFESFASCGTASDCELEVCTLGNGWRNANNSSEDDIDWRVDNGGTPSNNTGPDVDHTTGTGSGNYVYLEASNGCSEQEAQLLSPCIDLSNAVSTELSFWYHMYGGDMGELHLDVFDGSTWQLDVMTVLSGDKGDSWFQEMVNLDAYNGSTIQLRFRGVTGNDWESDLSLDDINIDIEGLSVDENEFAGSIAIYPNPSAGQITLDYDFGNVTCESINILDARGKQVKSTNPKNSKQMLTLDLSGLASGLYTVSFQTGTQQINRKLILRK
jgi:hypothetical protein